MAKHLTKLFDSMAKLKLREAPSKNKGSATKEKDKTVALTNSAFGMIAKDGEPVDFDKDCLCEGQVEVWLNRLMETMRSTIRHYMTDAVAMYEEKPRDVWLFDYPAQVSLCGTQIWWTSEVRCDIRRMMITLNNGLGSIKTK